MQYFSQDLIKAVRRNSLANWEFIDAVFIGDISIKLALDYLRDAVGDYRTALELGAPFYEMDKIKEDIAAIKKAIRKANAR